MTADLQRKWLLTWCLGVQAFGLILAGAALPATEAPTPTPFESGDFHDPG